MKKFFEGKILRNDKISELIFDMDVYCPDIINDCKAGQFVNIYSHQEHNTLPRPISLCEIDKENKIIRLMCQIVGDGLRFISTLEVGSKINVLGSLGNGFKLEKKEKYAIVGGGIGVPPLLELSKQLIEKNPEATIDVFIGFQNATILVEDFKKLGSNVNVHVATDSGAVGFKGNVIQLMESMNYSCDLVYSCGPLIMLKFLSLFCKKNNIPCYVSMEEHMACGIGACNACVIDTTNPKDSTQTIKKKCCTSGPIFKSADIVWKI